jgi:hypothetical protein
MTDIHDPTEVEALLQSCGTPLVEIFFVNAQGGVFYERHVADEETLTNTVKMTLERFPGARAVLPANVNGYRLLSSDGKKWTTRWYPTQEAAEMVAIHRA